MAYKSFLDLPNEIYEEAKAKGIDIALLALSGRSPDEVVAIVKGTPSPDSPLFALPKGMLRGTLGLTGGFLRGVGELTGSEALKRAGTGISEFAHEKFGLSPTSGIVTKVLGTVGDVLGLPIPGMVLAKGITKGVQLGGKLLGAERVAEGASRAALKMAIPTTFGVAGYGSAREAQEKYAPEIYETPEGQVRAGVTGVIHAGLSLVPFAEKFKFLRRLPVLGDSPTAYGAVSEALAFPIVAGLFDLASRFGAGVYADPSFTGELRKILSGLIEDTTKSDVIAMMLAGGILGALRGRFLTRHKDKLEEFMSSVERPDVSARERVGVVGRVEEGVVGKVDEVVGRAKVEEGKEKVEKGEVERGEVVGVVDRGEDIVAVEGGRRARDDRLVFSLSKEESERLSKALSDIINLLPEGDRYFDRFRNYLAKVIERLQKDNVLDLNLLPKKTAESVVGFLTNISDVEAYVNVFKTGDVSFLDNIQSKYFRDVARRYIKRFSQVARGEEVRDQKVTQGEAVEVQELLGKEGEREVSKRKRILKAKKERVEEGVAKEEVVEEGVAKKEVEREEVIPQVFSQQKEIDDIVERTKQFLAKTLEEKKRGERAEAGEKAVVEGKEGLLKVVKEKGKVVYRDRTGKEIVVEGKELERGKDYLRKKEQLLSALQGEEVVKASRKGKEKGEVLEEKEVLGQEEAFSLADLRKVFGGIEAGLEKREEKRESVRKKEGKGRRKVELDEIEELELRTERRTVAIPQRVIEFLNVPFIVEDLRQNISSFKEVFNYYRALEERVPEKERDIRADIERGPSVGEHTGPESVHSSFSVLEKGNLAELLYGGNKEILRAVKHELKRYSDKELRKYRAFMDDVVFPWLEGKIRDLDERGLISFALNVLRAERIEENPVFADLVANIKGFKGEKPEFATGDNFASFVTAYFLKLFPDGSLNYFRKLDPEFSTKLASLIYLWHMDPKFLHSKEGIQYESLEAFKQFKRDYLWASGNIKALSENVGEIKKVYMGFFDTLEQVFSIFENYRQGKILTRERIQERIKELENQIELLRRQESDATASQRLALLHSQVESLRDLLQTALSEKDVSISSLLLKVYGEEREQFARYIAGGPHTFRGLLSKDIMFYVTTLPERMALNVYTIWERLGGKKGQLDVEKFFDDVYMYMFHEFFGGILPKEVWEVYREHKDVALFKALVSKVVQEHGFLSERYSRELLEAINVYDDVFMRFMSSLLKGVGKEADERKFFNVFARAFSEAFTSGFNSQVSSWFFPSRYLKVLRDVFLQTSAYARLEAVGSKELRSLKNVEFLQRSLYDINNQRLDLTLKEFTTLIGNLISDRPEVVSNLEGVFENKGKVIRDLYERFGIGLIDAEGKISVERVQDLLSSLFSPNLSKEARDFLEVLRTSEYDAVVIHSNSLELRRFIPGKGLLKDKEYRFSSDISFGDRMLLQAYANIVKYLQRVNELGRDIDRVRVLWNLLPSIFPVRVVVGKGRRAIDLLLAEVRLPEYRFTDVFIDEFNRLISVGKKVDILSEYRLLNEDIFRESIKEALRGLGGEKVILVLDANKYQMYLDGKIKDFSEVLVSERDILELEKKKALATKEEVDAKLRVVLASVRSLLQEAGIQDIKLTVASNVVDSVAFRAFAYKFLMREDLSKFEGVDAKKYFADLVDLRRYVGNRLMKVALEGGFAHFLEYFREFVKNTETPSVVASLNKILERYIEGLPLRERKEEIDLDLRLSLGNNAELIGRIGEVYPLVYVDPILMYRFIQDTIARVIGEKVYVHIADRQVADVINRVLFGRSDVYGAYMKLRGMDNYHIYLALTDPFEFIKTFGHEVWHSVWKVLDVKEREYLLSKYKTIEEVAERFGDYVVGKFFASEREKGIFERVKEFIVKIMNFFRGYGFTDVESIFSKVWLGEYRRGEVKPEDIPIAFYENMRSWFDRYGSVEDKVQFEEYYLRAFERSQEILREKINRMNTFVRDVFGRGGIDEVSALYEKLRGERVGFWRKAFKYPVFDKTLSHIKQLYNRAEKVINEEVLIDAENFFRRFNSSADDVKEVFRKLAFQFGARSKFPFNVGDVLTKLGVVDISKQREIAELLAEWKRLTDKVYLEEKGYVLDLAYHRVRRKIADLYLEGLIPDGKLLLEFGDLYANFREAVLRTTEFEVVYDTRDNIASKLAKLGFSIEDVFEISGFSGDEKVVALLPKAIDYEAIKRLQDFVGSEKRQGDIYLRLTPEAIGKIYSAIDNFSAVFSGMVEEVFALQKSYYIPLVRKGGKYSVTVFAKDKKNQFQPIFYAETDKYSSDVMQRNELYELVRKLVDKYRAEGLKENQQYKLLVLDQWDGSGSLREFVRANVDVDTIERVIVFGRKKEGGSYVFNVLSPGEQLMFINELVNKYAVEKRGDLERALEEALSRYWASQSYARARAQARRRIPEEFGPVVEGYKDNFEEVAKEYIYRMSGHLKNNKFSFYFNEWLRSEEGQRVVGNPDLRDLVERYYKSLVTPASSFARIVYAIRMFASMYYLGLRISTALLNFVNAFTYTWPLLTNRVIERYAEEGWRLPYLTAAKEAGKYLLSGFKTLQELKSRGYLDRLFYLKPELLEQIRELYDKPLDEWVLFIGGKEVRPTDREVLLLKGLYDLFMSKIVESSFLRELRQEEMLRFGKLPTKLFDAVFWFFSNTERLARTASALGYLEFVYNTTKRIGSSLLEVPFTELQELIDKTFFDYTRANRPYWANPSTSFGALASIPLTLKGFVLNSINLYAEMFGQKQYKPLLHSLAVFFVLGGLSGLPFVDDILDVIERVVKEPIRMKIRNSIKNNIGDTPADFLVKGLPYVLGLDFSSSIKIELPLPKGFNTDELSKWLFGVYENVIERSNRGMEALLAGQYLEALIYLSPYGISLPLEAMRLHTEGMTTRGGRKVLIDGQEFYLDGVDTFLRVLGFRPRSLAEVQDYRFMVERIKNWYKEEKQRILKKYRIAVERGDGFDEVLRDIYEFNREVIEKGYQGIVPLITRRTLRQALRPERFSMEQAISF
ncbi:MAG: hypothetical protein QXT86_08890 [Archaeoglobaceae archaeon]